MWGWMTLACVLTLPALALSGIQLNLSLKYLIVAPIAVALCYLVAYGLRKVPFVRLVLG